MTNTPKVLSLVNTMGGCELWRTLLPFSELQRQGYPGIEWGMRDDDRLANIVGHFDAIILQRLHWPMSEQDNANKWFGALRKAGKATIYEVDDDLFSDDFVGRLISMHGYDQPHAEERRVCIINALRSCDGVTVTNQHLATIVRELTDKPVKVVGNYIDLRWWKQVQGMSERKIFGFGWPTIGWAGGVRPDADVEPMAIAWGRIARRYPKVKFIVQGHHAKVIYDTVPNDHIYALDWLPIEAYPAGVMNIDIGCCSLSDTPFNRCKTFIKAMEYAMSGAAVVASPTLYNRIIDHGKNGLIADTPDEWEEALSRLIEDYEYRRQLTKTLRSKVRRLYGLEDNAWRWLEAWSSIIQEFRDGNRYRILLPSEVKYGIQSYY